VLDGIQRGSVGGVGQIGQGGLSQIKLGACSQPCPAPSLMVIMVSDLHFTESFVQYVLGQKHLCAKTLPSRYRDHCGRWLCPIALPVVRGRTNPVHKRHPHTVGSDACTWFGCPHTTAEAVSSKHCETQKIIVTFLMHALVMVWGYIC
jgi:hypothetical protein